MERSQIIAEIQQHMIKCGGSYPSWYVGVSEEPETRLSDGHGAKDAWIYREAESTEIAREIEAYFIERLNTDGGSGGGDEDATYVYAYKKKPHTTP